MKTLIIYATTANLAAINAEAELGRARGQLVRLVAIEQFRGETETDAGAVMVERQDDDAIVVDAIAAAYPHLEITDLSRSIDFKDMATYEPKTADAELKNLRLRLIRLGGNAPAGSTADQLAELIAEQEANAPGGSMTPVMPTPASAGTVIPDSTPVVLRNPAEAVIAPTATGTTTAQLDAAREGAGNTDGAPTTTTVGEHSAVDTSNDAPLTGTPGAKAASDTEGKTAPEAPASGTGDTGASS